MEDFRGSDQFMTPPEEIERARSYFLGKITTDPASSYIAQRYVKADYYAVSEQEATEHPLWRRPTEMGVNGLDFYWRGNVWLNPPYSKGLIDAFTNKALHEWDSGSVDRMLILVNSATDTKWFHSLVHNATRVFHYRSRLKFWKMIDGQAFAKWQGQKNKDDIAAGKTTKVKIGNSPRFLNTLFLFERQKSRLQLFHDIYSDHGAILIPER